MGRNEKVMWGAVFMSSDGKKPIESKWTFIAGTSPIRTLFLAIALLLTVLYAVNSVTGTVPALQHDVLFASEPKLDASSMEALDRSVREMSNALPESERQEFSQIVEFLIVRNYDSSMGVPAADYPAVQLKPWHGYTARRLVAAHRDDYAASLVAAEVRREREAEEAREFEAAQVKKGHEEVRRLKAIIASEPEILAKLAKTEIHVLDPKWSAYTIRKLLAGGGLGQFRGFQLDLDFVVQNRTDVGIGEINIRVDLVNRRDGSILDTKYFSMDFGPSEDFLTGELFDDADPILPGTSRQLRKDALFEIDEFPLDTDVDANAMKNLTRVEARAISVTDIRGVRSFGIWQINDARRDLERWEKFLAGE